MGLTKRMLEEMDRRWEDRFPKKRVCESCLNDEALSVVLARHAERGTCSYCYERRETNVAPLAPLVEHIVECISQDYADPAEAGLPYCSREGGYLGSVLDAQEVLDEVGFEPENSQLADDIASCLWDTHWTSVDWQILDPVARRLHSWEQFKEVIKHERRFTFWSVGDKYEEPHHPDYTPVGEALTKIVADITEIGLVRNLPRGTILWRVRSDTATCTTAQDFASAPNAIASQNRMSPAGISMFYAASSLDTAKSETIDSQDLTKAVCGAAFRTIIDVPVLRLTSLPRPPSYFSLNERSRRIALQFLYEFVHDLSKPIKRNGAQEHIEYVPTQAFTEYIRWTLKDRDGRSIHGLTYPSSKNNEECYVLFLDHIECLSETSIIEFDPRSVRTI